MSLQNNTCHLVVRSSGSSGKSSRDGVIGSGARDTNINVYVRTREFDSKDKILYTRNQDLRNHCGFSVAFASGCSVAFSNGISIVSGSFQRIVTFPVDLHWNYYPLDFQWHSPMEFHSCDFWCVICCPDIQSRAAPTRHDFHGGIRSAALRSIRNVRNRKLQWP